MTTTKKPDDSVYANRRAPVLAGSRIRRQHLKEVASHIKRLGEETSPLEIMRGVRKAAEDLVRIHQGLCAAVEERAREESALRGEPWVGMPSSLGESFGESSLSMSSRRRGPDPLSTRHAAPLVEISRLAQVEYHLFYPGQESGPGDLPDAEGFGNAAVGSMVQVLRDMGKSQTEANRKDPITVALQRLNLAREAKAPPDVVATLEAAVNALVLPSPPSPQTIPISASFMLSGKIIPASVAEDPEPDEPDTHDEDGPSGADRAPDPNPY